MYVHPFMHTKYNYAVPVGKRLTSAEMYKVLRVRLGKINKANSGQKTQRQNEQIVEYVRNHYLFISSVLEIIFQHSSRIFTFITRFAHSTRVPLKLMCMRYRSGSNPMCEESFGNIFQIALCFLVRCTWKFKRGCGLTADQKIKNWTVS